MKNKSKKKKVTHVARLCIEILYHIHRVYIGCTLGIRIQSLESALSLLENLLHDKNH